MREPSEVPTALALGARGGAERSCEGGWRSAHKDRAGAECAARYGRIPTRYSSPEGSSRGASSPRRLAPLFLHRIGMLSRTSPGRGRERMVRELADPSP